MPRKRKILIGLAAIAGLLGGVLLWLAFDDPSTRFAERRGTLHTAQLDTADNDGRFIVQPVRVQSTSGLAVDLLVKRPASGAPGPLVLLLGGHVTGREAAHLIPDTRGLVIVAMSYPYAGPHRMRGTEVLRHAGAIRQALHDTPPAVQLALDWLLDQPWVDATQVEAVGVSLGTPFMTVATAIDPRITRLWNVHGAGRTQRLLTHNARGTVPAALAPATGAFANLVISGRYLTPERWAARVAPRPMVMINASEDERLPRDAVEALFDAAGDPKEMIWLPGQHVLRSRPDVVRALVDTVLARLERPI